MDASKFSPELRQTLRTANRKEAARALGISEPTLDVWFDDGCPVVEKGGHGRSYTIDVFAAHEWNAARVAEKEKADAARLVQIDEFRNQIDLDLGDPNDDGRSTLKQTKEYYETESKRMDLEIRRGGLVRAGDVERIFLGVLGMLSERLQSLPDYLERAAALDAETTALIADKIEDWQAELARDLAKDEGATDDNNRHIA